MSKRMGAALVLEAVIVAAVVALVAASSGPSASRPLLAVGLGLGVMGALTIPSLLLLMWGRERSNPEFMASVGSVLLGKFLVVGLGVLYVWTRTDLPRLEFLLGLMGGWVASFAVQVAVLRVTLKRPAAGGRT